MAARRRVFGPKRELLEEQYTALTGLPAPAGLFAEFAGWIHVTTFRRLKIAAILAICINTPLFFAFDLPSYLAGYAQSQPGFVYLVAWRITFVAVSVLFLLLATTVWRHASTSNRSFRHGSRAFVLVLALLGAIQAGYAHVVVHDVSIYALHLCAIAALLHTPDRLRWFAYAAAFLTLVVLAGLAKPPEIFFSMLVNAVPVTAVSLAVEIIVFRQLEDVFINMKIAAAEREKSEALLRNVLPEAIALRLRDGPRMIAEGFADATILFADLVGFTELSSRTEPEALVDLLNDAFGRFDNLAARHGVEKIKTIGDAYMVACGLPEKNVDHLAATAEFALDLLDELERVNEVRGVALKLRVGLHCGYVVAGVIGNRKFSYDVWGDSVNLASRMESTGVPGRIQVTESAAQRLRDRYVLEERGTITVKGKGEQKTYFLTGRRVASPAAVP